MAVAALTPLLALALYLFVGAPGAADAPFAARVAAWRAGDPGLLDPPRIAAVLKAIAADNPSDPEPLRNLALARMASGDAFGAVSALRKAVALAPERADLWVQLGEAFVAQSEGEVGPDAKAAFREALKREPGSAVARYYVGRAAIAEGDVEAGLMLWRRLMGEMDAGDPRRAALAAEIAQVDRGGR